MKRLLVLFVLTLLLTAAPAHAALTFFWACESETLSSGTTDYSAGDTSATQQPAAGPAVNATAMLVGTNGCEMSASGEHYRFDNSSNALVSPSAGSFGLWIRAQSRATNGAFFYARGNSSANDYVDLATTATDELRCRTGSSTGPVTNSVTTTALNYSLDTTYFVTCSWEDSGDRLRICVYDSGGSVLDGGCTVNSSATNAFPTALDSTTGLRIGESSGSAQTEYFDNVFIGDAYADADTFYTNRNITAYTSYSAGGSVNFFSRRLQVNP